MTRAIPEGYRENAKGCLIPERNIREIDLKRDALVSGLIAQAKQHAGTLVTFKEAATQAIADFTKESAEAFKTKLGGKKGNLTLYSYNGQYKVNYANSDFLVFDERLQIAKHLIDKCIKSWSHGANDNLMALINQAFAVDSEGNVNTKRVLELKQLKIDDANWKKAMEAIAQATQVVATKSYIRFYERQDNGEYKQISLNIAAD